VAAILVARRLSPFDGGKKVPATITAISDEVRWAEAILKEIDRKWPPLRIVHERDDFPEHQRRR
jgi:hypothetical protein